MFKKFSFKIRINVALIVFITLAIQFILTYILFFSIFTEDFKQKSDELGNQISNHVTLRLQYVEEAVRIFCSDHDIQNALENFDSSLTNNMSSLTATGDIRGGFINGEKHSYYFSSEYIRDFSHFFDYVAPQFKHANKSGYWSLYNSRSAEKGSYLLYSYVIRDDNMVPIGVLSVDVSLQNLYDSPEKIAADLMEYTSVYISSQEGDKKIFLGNEDAENLNSEALLKTYLYADNLQINTVSTFDYIQEKLTFVIVLMITILAVTLISLFIILYVYSAHLTKRMTDLTYRMNNFIDRQ